MKTTEHNKDADGRRTPPTCSALSELLSNLEEWGEHFRERQHGATLSILRAKKTLADQADRIELLEDTLNHLWHYTDCTTGQMRVIEKVFPELGGRADHTESDTGHETTPQAHSPQNAESSHLRDNT